MSQEAKKFLRGFLLITAVDVPLQFKGLLVIPIMTKLIGLSDYGEYVQVQTFISLLAGVLVIGLPQSLLRFLPALRGSAGERKFFSSIYLLVLGVGLVACPISYLFSVPLSSLLGIPAHLVFIAGVISALQSLFHISVEYYRAVEQMGRYSLLLGSKNALELAAVVLAALLTRSIDSVFFALLGIGLLCNFAMLLLIFGKINWLVIDKSIIQHALKFSVPLAVTILLVWFTVMSDRLLVGMILGNRSVGIYNSAYTLAALMLFLPRLFVAVLPPMSARLYDGGRIEEVSYALSLALKYFLQVAIAFVAGLVILSEPALALLSTKEVAAEGYWISIIVAFSIIFLGVGQILSVALEVKMKTSYAMYIWVLAAAVNVFMNILLLPMIGLYAAALSDFVAYGIVGILFLHKSASLLPIHLDIKVLAKSLIAAAGMALVVNLFNVRGFLGLALVVLIGLTSYAVMLWVLRTPTTTEATYLRESISRLLPNWLLLSHRKDT